MQTHHTQTLQHKVPVCHQKAEVTLLAWSLLGSPSLIWSHPSLLQSHSAHCFFLTSLVHSTHALLKSHLGKRLQCKGVYPYTLPCVATIWAPSATGPALEGNTWSKRSVPSLAEWSATACDHPRRVTASSSTALKLDTCFEVGSFCSFHIALYKKLQGC